jgi:DNA ligase-1
MLLAAVVETSRQIADTSKRTEKVGLLARLLRQFKPEEIEVAVPYLSGRTRQGKTGIGWRAIQDGGSEPAETATLEVMEADRRLDAIAKTVGRGSAGQRGELLRRLFADATAGEQRFLTALLAGELRQGSLEGLMAEAIAKASGVPLDRVRRAAMMAGDLAAIAHAALEEGEAGLARYDVQLFRPLQPMLAQSAEDAGEALAEFGRVALEYKMDGARVQVHKSGDDVAVYTRSLNDVTLAVPEVVEVARAMPVHDLILDGEVIGLLPDGRPRPFQETMRRFGRKLEVDRMRTELPLTPFFFDALYLDGQSLMDEPQGGRFSVLAEIAPPPSLIPHLITSDPIRAGEFVRESLGLGHEGVMAKSPEASYAAGGRGRSWLKIKQARTLDLVILAAEWGNGRRQGFLSNLHLGARDTGMGGYAMLGKTFKGLTDEMLAWQTQELLKSEIGRDSYTVYVEPKIVVEIAFNEIQVSSRYASGLALRFARVKRYRPDKLATASDTFDTVKKLAGTPS